MIEDFEYILENLEWALEKALNLLEEWCPNYETDPIIDAIIDIFKVNFD